MTGKAPKNNDQNEKQNSNESKNSDPNKNRFSLKNFYSQFRNSNLDILIMLGVGFWLYSEYFMNDENSKEIKEEILYEKIKAEQIAKLTVMRDPTNKAQGKIIVTEKYGQILGCIKTANIDQILAKSKELNKAGKIIDIEEYKGTHFTYNDLILLAIIGIGILALRGRKPTKSGSSFNGMDRLADYFTAGSSRAVEYGVEKKIDITFKDVAGLDGPKEEIQEIVQFLKAPDKFTRLGAKIPKGTLLTGPPGTGKTLLAKACAGEAGVAFFAASGSEFVEMYVGVGASRVRDLFAKAKKKSPAIIFIDEIDAIGRKRSRMESNDERESTLNQMFVEMDGFGTDTNVIVLAATNRREMLDPALVRPGRFDRIIEVNLPSIKEREEIFGVHLRSLKTESSLTKPDIAKKLAPLTAGMSGAEIMSVCNEAAICAGRYNKESVSMKEFYDAFDRISSGLKRSTPLKDWNRKLVAFHEAGHTVAGWFLSHAQQILKVSIIPRSKGSLGHTQMLNDEISLFTKEQLLDTLKVIYGGRAAEELFLGTSTTGASDDISRATALAKQFVGAFGMCPEFGKACFEAEIYGGERIKISESSHQRRVNFFFFEII